LTLLQDDPSPPPDPRLAIAGYTTGKYVIKTVGTAAPKSKLRIAPYIAKPYTFDQRISCGPGPPTQVVVTGFDPLTSDSQIRAFFTAFGEVDGVRNQVHPDNGSPLGICLVKFRDTAASRGVVPIKASSSAKRAEREGTNQRIGLKVVKVQSDREGKRCDWLVKKAVDHTRGEEEKRRAKLAPTIAPPSADLPANVPKGPSGKGISMRPPVPGAMPILATSRTTRSSLLVEHEPIKPQMKRTPYLFIAHQHVPVLSTTVAHLKKRLKAFHWQAVRCDPTGYFVTFEESKRGEDEAVKCFTQCHTAALFTYSMFMECNQYGDPDYERSPSPERVVVEKKRKAEETRLAEEEAEELEWEKKQRAEALDPVIAAAEIVKQELLEKLASDIKSRIAGPALLDLMEPEKHLSKRRKLNVADPQSKAETVSPAFFARGMNSPAIGTPNSRSGFASRQPPRKALAAYDANRMRGKKPPRVVNAFADERRKAAPPRRRINNPMAQLLALEKDFAHETDDDEGRSSFTRDTEEQESRPMSRAPSTESEDEESSRAHRAKRRRIEAGWGEESDDEMMDDSHARSLLAHLIHKDPENMAEMELEQVLAILPRSSPIWKKAEKALKGFRRLRKIEQEADAIFGVESIAEDKLTPEVIITNDDEEARKPVETTELAEPVKAPKKKVSVPKTKKKTKKQLEEEAKAEQAEAAELASKHEEVEAPEPVVEEPEPAPEETPEEEERASVHYGVSTDTPQRTVDDDLSVVMDIDGWQHLLKDDEDLGFLTEALLSTVSAKINDPLKWAWRQKQIKNLNRQGEEGVCRTETKIEGYYVLNSTGSARTEGVQKIRESEKSKYLPHRIRVQKEREARERLAKNEARTTTVVEGFKFTTGTKLTSAPQASNSRANRANNRRLVNDINISKNMAGAEADSMRFNQLKKRKKFVKFDRSAIHNWGLYAQESITANDMIIEYVGEKVRQRVADLREAKYDIQGVGSSYLFRIDEDTVVDATKMGGIARFINHSCTPNCTAKIIRVDGTKRIVIYALRDIGKGKTSNTDLIASHANVYEQTRNSRMTTNSSAKWTRPTVFPASAAPSVARVSSTKPRLSLLRFLCGFSQHIRQREH
jgi:histone-lysine N-methyltransferase SETD1